MQTAKTLIRLGGCPGWSESSLEEQPFCWFCHVAAHLFYIKCSIQRKTPKNLDTQQICGNHPKIQRRWLYKSVAPPKIADRMANSEDWSGAVSSGSTLFAKTCLSENLRTLQYIQEIFQDLFSVLKKKCCFRFQPHFWRGSVGQKGFFLFSFFIG